MFSFQWPWLLLAFFLPLLVYKFVIPAKLSQNALMVPFYQQLETTAGPLRSPQWTRLSLLLVLWLLLLIAAAKPVWQGAPQPLNTSPRDLMLAVDISGSMETKDMQLGQKMVDRLTGIKVVLDGFIKRRNQDRMGLILFADNAYIQTPLTLDHKVLANFLSEAQIGFAGRKTAIGDAIGLAIKRMQNSPEKSKVLVLLTDGANTAGTVTPLSAAAVAAEQGLKIYTLGFGADEMLVKSFFGDRRVNPSIDLDEQSLQKIADMTGGKYFRARSIEQLVGIYQLLDQLEPQPIDGKIIVPQRALFYWPLGVALLLSMLWALLHLLVQHGFFAALKNTKKVDDVS
ncbi:MAG: VWA domain-containing protein [Pseudomonadales bacterium]|nr:VWA domain-containing protein [Pseudomonadales bacterium]NRA17717.1 VWA domain-containing protein [Oceanospirillaceae bacterium]